MSALEKVNKDILDNAKNQQRLFSELNDLINHKSSVLRKMGHIQCNSCTKHDLDDNMTYCGECGESFCNDHCEDNICKSCNEGY